MTRWRRNPQRFAVEEIHATFNATGRFSHFMDRSDPQRLRLRLGATPGVGLVAWLRDLDGDVTSLFRHARSGGLVLIREWRCPDSSGCDGAHGTVDVIASSRVGLLAAVALVVEGPLGGVDAA